MVSLWSGIPKTISALIAYPGNQTECTCDVDTVAPHASFNSTVCSSGIVGSGRRTFDKRARVHEPCRSAHRFCRRAHIRLSPIPGSAVLDGRCGSRQRHCSNWPGPKLVRTDTAGPAVGLAAASESRRPNLVDSLDRTSQPNSGACELHSVNVCRGSTCCRSLHCHAARMSPLLINDSEAHKRVKRGERRMAEHPLVNICLTQELADRCCKHWCNHCLLATAGGLRLAISLPFGACDLRPNKSATNQTMQTAEDGNRLVILARVNAADIPTERCAGSHQPRRHLGRQQRHRAAP
jgi:hypothetical protein